MLPDVEKLVFTVQTRCRLCYTCVRECPAKAIRIVNGQADVIISRCIGCGTCTRVCSQGAKQYYRSIDDVLTLLKENSQVIACIAPSFPAEFDFDYTQLIGMIRAVGFSEVTEVAFGADVVASEYKTNVYSDPKARTISSNCPAIVHYVRHYHPDLVDSLAKIVSPIVAMARILRKKFGENTKIVFIGPCIAKKVESAEIDAALTFRELRQLFDSMNIKPTSVIPSEFDSPVGGKGAIFPVNRGMIQTADIDDNIVGGNVIVAEGQGFQDALKEFEEEKIQNQHLDLLCCNGCIMGPGMSNGGRQYSRRLKVGKYVRNKMRNFDVSQWFRDLDEFSDIDLVRKFDKKDRRLPLPNKEEIESALLNMGKVNPSDFLNCGACGYETCFEHAIAIVQGYAEEEMCLPYTIEKLHKSINELAISNEKLASMQQALKQQEKLASMGQLSAGIAHELNNPLGVVIMYANILLDEAEANHPIREDLRLIVEQAERCKKIVGGLLNFARKNQVKFAEIPIEKLTKQSLDSLIIPTNVDISIENKCKDSVAELDVEQMIQVLNNLVKNAIEAMPEAGGKINICLKDTPQEVSIIVSDSGTGIEKENLDKIFEPFFTTKGIGKGTGLGLATTYGIVKMHKGQIVVTSNTDKSKGSTGTTFNITLPRHRN